MEDLKSKRLPIPSKTLENVVIDQQFLHYELLSECVIYVVPQSTLVEEINTRNMGGMNCFQSATVDNEVLVPTLVEEINTPISTVIIIKVPGRGELHDNNHNNILI